MTHLAHVITAVRAKSRPSQYNAILLAEIDRLRAAIATHHATRWTAGRAVLSPPDRALYDAAGEAYRVLDWDEGGDVAEGVAI